jgi:arylsulfatase A-like enzyme
MMAIIFLMLKISDNHPMRTKGKGAVILSLIILFSSQICLSAERPANPNIILITMDSLRADHLGFMGYHRATTPFLDELAKESIVFTRCFSASASTASAISALFTSHYPYIDKALVNKFCLSTRYRTLAEYLRAKGYSTIGLVAISTLLPNFGFDRGFANYRVTVALDGKPSFSNMLPAVKEAVEKLGKRSAPVFLWMHFSEPHYPFLAPLEYRDNFADDLIVPNAQRIKQTYLEGGIKVEYDQQELFSLIKQYDASVRYADASVKEVFDYLRHQGFLDKAAIFITADHGEDLGENGLIAHNYLHFPIIHVPLIVHIPGQTPERRDDLVSHLDIFPTVIDLLGSKNQIKEKQLRGKSLLERRGHEEFQLSEIFEHFLLLQGKWMLNVDRNSEDQDKAFFEKGLFDMDRDPLRKNNLFREESKQAEKMIRTLEDITYSPRGWFKHDLGQYQQGQEVIEELRALGYLQ